MRLSSAIYNLAAWLTLLGCLLVHGSLMVLGFGWLLYLGTQIVAEKIPHWELLVFLPCFMIYVIAAQWMTHQTIKDTSQVSPLAPSPRSRNRPASEGELLDDEEMSSLREFFAKGDGQEPQGEVR